jgi:hypothetical protein
MSQPDLAALVDRLNALAKAIPEGPTREEVEAIAADLEIADDLMMAVPPPATMEDAADLILERLRMGVGVVDAVEGLMDKTGRSAHWQGWFTR